MREDAYWLSLALRENVSEFVRVDPSKKNRRPPPRHPKAARAPLYEII